MSVMSVNEIIKKAKLPKDRMQLSDAEYHSLEKSSEYYCILLQQLRDKGSITDSQYQNALDEIFENSVNITKRTWVAPFQFSREGFFQNLKNYIEDKGSSRISEKMRENLTEDTYSQLLQQKIDIFIKEPKWIVYFVRCDYLKPPEPFDIETAHKMNDAEIVQLLKVLINALKQHSENGLENSKECQILHEYYKLLKHEGKTRQSLKDVIQSKDSHADWLANKATYQTQTQQLAHTRLTGKICIYCNSQNIRSNGNMWTCRDCKKSFRKHF